MKANDQPQQVYDFLTTTACVSMSRRRSFQDGRMGEPEEGAVGRLRRNRLGSPRGYCERTL